MTASAPPDDDSWKALDYACERYRDAYHAVEMLRGRVSGIEDLILAARTPLDRGPDLAVAQDQLKAAIWRRESARRAIESCHRTTDQAKAAPAAAAASRPTAPPTTRPPAAGTARPTAPPPRPREPGSDA